MTDALTATERHRIRRKRSCSPLIILAVLAACLTLMGTAAYLALRIPAQTETLYGPPAPQLDRSRVTFYSIVLIGQESDLLEPADPLGPDVVFTIQQGESTASLIRNLYQAGLINDTTAFSTYLSYRGLDTTIQAGEYYLSPSMTPVEIADALQDATPKEVDFVIIPGWRMAEVARALPTSGLAITPEELALAALEPPSGWEYSSEIPPGMGLEGFLMPGSYIVPRETGASELIEMFLRSFSSSLSPDLRAGFENQGLSLYEGITLASIVEREAMIEEEMPLIASVFFNRLRVGMTLSADPTVQYAIGYNENQDAWWTNPLSLADLEIDSPYNTYIYPGLPPGPIANPSLRAMEAAAYPADTPYYFFRSACDGSGRHLFAETFNEHLQNECP